MRIAIGGISLLGPLTGIGQYTLHLSKELQKLNIDVDLFLGSSWKNTACINQPNLSVQQKTTLHHKIWGKVKAYIPNARSNLHHLRQKKFTKGILASKIPFDLYHEPNFIPWESNLPSVITIHDLSWIRHPETHPKDRVAWLNKSISKAIDASEKIIVVSDFVRDELIDLFGVSLGSKIKRVYNGVEEKFYPKTASQTQGTLNQYNLIHKKYFLALGTLEPRKNLKSLIDAYLLLPANFQDHYPLIIAGSIGWLNHDLANYIGQSTHKNIRHIGYVPQNSIPNLVAGALAMVYPSIYEGFGLPALESMASGTVTITSQAKALVEITNQAGINIDANDINGFKDAMHRLVQDPEWATTYETKGFQQSKKFSWEKTAQETYNIYKEIIGN